MVLIFQFGSNMSQERINSGERLNGTAQFVDTAWTVEDFEFEFSVWSKSNSCAAANLARGRGCKIWGVLYEVHLQRVCGPIESGMGKSLDRIEGEGVNYLREKIDVQRCSDGKIVNAETYLALKPQSGIQTSLHYIQHILDGLREHSAPADYIEYVRKRIIENNPGLRDYI